MSRDPSFVFWLAGGFCALAAGIFYFSWRYEKQRTAALSDVALRMGFSFAARDDAVLVAGFPLFERGRARRATNVMTSSRDGRAVTVFDYRYVTGGGKNSHTQTMTVVMFDGFGALPAFDMVPENIVTRFANAFGWQDIDFDASPEFSNAYLLRGTDEAAVRATFGSDVLSFFAGAKNWSVHSGGGRLALLRAPERRCKPEELPQLLDECTRVAGVFARVLA